MLVDQSWRYAMRDSDRQFYNRLLPPQHPLLDALECIQWDSFIPLLEAHYCADRGQPAIPPLLFLKFEFLRYLHRSSDREVIARAETDVIYRWFLQIPVRCRLPDPSSLVRFRGRLGEEGHQKIFDHLVGLARQVGLVRDRLRLKDASHMIAKIAIPSTLKLLAQLREKMLEQVTKIDPQMAQGFEIELKRIRCETAKSQGDKRLETRVELLREILQFLSQQNAPDQAAADPAWQELQAVCDLARKVLDDKTNPAASDKIVSLVDTDARRSKHGEWYEGYSIDISMDADSQLITAVDVLPAGGDEAKSAVKLVSSEQQTHGNQIENFSIDGAGFNGPMLRELENPEGLNVTVYTPTRASSAEETIPVSAFEQSADGKCVTCPEGQRSSTRQRDNSRHRTFFQFRRATCAGCPLQPKCKPELGDGKYGGRGVTKNDYEFEHERARTRTKTEAYAAVRREHPAIERKINEVMNQQGARHAKYWGRMKTKTQAFMTCFTVNVKRMTTLQVGMLCADAS